MCHCCSFGFCHTYDQHNRCNPVMSAEFSRDTHQAAALQAEQRRPWWNQTGPRRGCGRGCSSRAQRVSPRRQQWRHECRVPAAGPGRAPPLPEPAPPAVGPPPWVAAGRLSPGITFHCGRMYVFTLPAEGVRPSTVARCRAQRQNEEVVSAAPEGTWIRQCALVIRRSATHQTCSIAYSGFALGFQFLADNSGVGVGVSKRFRGLSTDSKCHLHIWSALLSRWRRQGKCRCKPWCPSRCLLLCF